MAQNIEAYLTPEACAFLRAQIADAGGNEVCFRGELDRAGRVAVAQVLARGHTTAVNALTHLARPGDVIIHNHPQEAALVPSDADMDIAGTLGDAGIASFIVNNAVDAIYVIVEPIPPKALVTLSTDAVASYIEPGGPVASLLAGYEHRSQQREMLDAVVGAFNNRRVALVEAGTGTGKTLAYLFPALLWALENGERVVVSTNTINLQEQLLTKDLPVVERALGRKVKAVLVKGRANYACKRKVDLQRQQADLFSEEDERAELETLLAWAAQTKDGSRADLNFTPRPSVWELIQSDTDTSLRTRCPHYATCFYHGARREANTADLLVVNHSLLLADLALRAQTGNYTDLGVLPRYDRIILDEAHHLEDVATRHFGARTTNAGLYRVLGRISRRNRRGHPRGALAFLRQALSTGAGLRAVTDEIFAFLDEEVLPLHGETLDAIPDLVESMEQFIQSRGDGAGGEQQWSVPGPEHVQEEIPAEVREAVDRFLSRGGRLVARLNRLVRLLRHDDRDVDEALLPSRTELRAQAGRLETHLTTLRTVMAGGEEGDVCWLTRRAGRGGRPPLIGWDAAPINVGTRLAQGVFDRFGTVVLSSATLAIDGNFQFVTHRVGLNRLAAPERLSSLALPSPFAFEEQMGVGLPDDLPLPNESGYATAVEQCVREAVALTAGRALVLFTSFRALESTYAACAPGFEEVGLTVLRQGDEPRDVLLRRFRADETSVLFAVDSFWEGVDVSGSALRNVIICKLPFRVPTDPVFAARAAAIEAAGGSAFFDYTVPLAVLKVKQGVGRLIRNHTDSGCVIILDSRIVRKQYGRAFRAALPPGHLETGPWEDVRAGLARFLRAFE